MSPKPIFICGPDRSGTTLIYALLASHPNLSMVRRTNMWRYFYDRYGELSRPENLERCLSDMTRYNRMRHLLPDRERIRREFRQGEPTYGRLFALFHEHNAERAGRTRWGDKSLHTERYVDHVVAEFPDARIIQMVRDPRDRYASVRKRFGRDTPRLGASAGRWLLAQYYGHRNHKRYPDNTMFVRFETLASEPEATLRQICEFIQEPYAPEMLTMQGAKRYATSGGNSSFDRIAPGVISTKPIGRYRSVLTPHEIAYIQFVCGREMAAFDYEPDPVSFALPDQLQFAAVTVPYQTARMAGWLAVNLFELRKGVRVPSTRLMPEPNDLNGGKHEPFKEVAT